MKSFLQLLKIALKYGIYVTVIVNIFEFAISEFEKLENPKDDIKII